MNWKLSVSLSTSILLASSCKPPEKSVEDSGPVVVTELASVYTEPAPILSRFQFPVQLEGIPLVQAEDYDAVWKSAGREVWVVGAVREAERHKSGMLFINFSLINTGLVVVSFPANQGNFGALGSEKDWEGRVVMIRGLVLLHDTGKRKRPQIVIQHQDQVRVMNREDLLGIDGVSEKPLGEQEATTSTTGGLERK